MQLNTVRVIAALNGLELFGHERGNIEVFKALRDRGAEVLVGVNAIRDSNAVAQHLSSIGFTTFAVPFGNQWSWMWLKRHPMSVAVKAKQMALSSSALARAIRQFKPTHLHLGSPLAYSFLAPTLTTCRIPLVYRMGDLPPVDSSFNFWVWQRAMRRTSRLVCISEFVRNAAMAAGVPRAEVIYNTAPTRDHSCQQSETVTKGVLPPRLLYVGAISPHKGLMALIEAFGALASEHDNLTLDVVGGSQFEIAFEREVRSRVALLGLQHRVVFHGFVEDPYAFYANATIHVAPTIADEPLGNVVLEAKRLRKPSVVFPSGGLAELVHHMVDGYVCADKSAASLAQGLRWVLADAQRVRALGNAAREDFDRRFGRDRFSEQWCNLYQNLQ